MGFSIRSVEGVGVTHCQRKGCRARLSYNNKTGLCKAHANQCRAEGCEEWVGQKSQSKLCLAHRMAKWREEHPERCCVQCNDTLHHNNKGGTCGRCKSINRQRASKKCECGVTLDHKNKSGKCFRCLHPGVSHNPNRKHTFKRSPKYTVRELTATAAWLTMTPAETLIGIGRQQYITRIRFAIWHLARPHYSYPHIGRVFGDRDHSTIIHGCERAAALIETDKNFATLVTSIERETLVRKTITERNAA